MIVDVPTKADFECNGTAFLNLGWDSAINLALNLAEAHVDWDNTTGVAEKYWDAAQKPLATALALAQQGTEFLLKAKIAEVSPYLLISGPPSEWPKGCDLLDKSFADFKTIDAQDLLRAHDTVTSAKLSDEFKIRFEQLRRLRNTVLHSVDKRTHFKVKEVLIAILEVAHELLAPLTWVKIRKQAIRLDPTSTTTDTDYSLHVAVRELLLLKDMLHPVEMSRYFGVNKKQRWYICAHCNHEVADWTIGAVLAQLLPNTAVSTTVRCLGCECEHVVKRVDCGYDGCKGNVIDSDYGICLTCGHQN